MRRSPLAVLLAGALAFAIGTSGAGASGTTVARVCANVSFPVSVPGLAHRGTIAGTLCRPATLGPRAATLQLLLHGGTYNRSYWDFPYQPWRYSYVDAAIRQGFSTLAIDRLGYGASSHPLSLFVTEAAQASTVHQVIGQVRAGKLGAAFSRIVVVAHSMGSATAIAEAGTYHDVDALVVTGLLHHVGSGFVQVLSSIWPADVDPRFKGTTLDPGYVTTRPGLRASDFYYAPETDPEVVTIDEATKDSMAGIEADGYVNEVTRLPGLWRAPDITVPVLVVVGDHDIINCGSGLDCSDLHAVRANEASAYQHAPSLTVDVQRRGDGHDLNTERNSPAFFRLVNRWIEGH